MFKKIFYKHDQVAFKKFTKNPNMEKAVTAMQNCLQCLLGKYCKNHIADKAYFEKGIRDQFGQ